MHVSPFFSIHSHIFAISISLAVGGWRFVLLSLSPLRLVMLPSGFCRTSRASHPASRASLRTAEWAYRAWQREKLAAAAALNCSTYNGAGAFSGGRAGGFDGACRCLGMAQWRDSCSRSLHHLAYTSPLKRRIQNSFRITTYIKQLYLASLISG